MDSQTPLAIIGTAGRKEDKDRLTGDHHDKMVDIASKLMIHLKLDGPNTHLVSGGAAFADHVVVTLGLTGVVPPENITLYLPSHLGPDGYFGENEWQEKTAKTAMYYHSIFSEKIGRNSIQEIQLLKDKGATLEVISGGFKVRNTRVAKHVSPIGHLLAFTFGIPSSHQTDWSVRPFGPTINSQYAGLKDGGTADTWNKSSCLKYHCKIGYDPIILPY